MTIRRHNTPPSEAQWKIIYYTKDHPGQTHKEIAAATGTSTSYVGETIMVHLPHLCRPRNMTGGPSVVQQKVIDYKRAHLDTPQKEIARNLGVAPSTVSLAIRTYIAGEVPPIKNHGNSHKKKGMEGPYVLRPCLRCGQPHESTWPGDRLHPRCRESIESEYTGAYSVSMGHKTGGGYRV